MKQFLILLALLISGCANVSSTRMVLKTEASTLMLDMPKELETKNLKIKFNAQQGTFEITSDSWITRNSDTIAAQTEREKAILESSSTFVEKATEAAVRSAIKSAMPIPTLPIK